MVQLMNFIKPKVRFLRVHKNSFFFKLDETLTCGSDVKEGFKFNHCIPAQRFAAKRLPHLRYCLQSFKIKNSI